jgi:8-oxo-dGTP pyrophosphatase MutT (NUDIX family)
MQPGGKFNFLYSSILKKIEVVKIDEEHYEFNGDDLKNLFKSRDLNNPIPYKILVWSFKFYNKIRLVDFEEHKQPEAVCLLLRNQDNKFLTVTRKDSDLIGIPGGKVDKDEKVLDALIREIKEETNLDLLKLNNLSFKLIFASIVDGYFCWTYTLMDEYNEIYSIPNSEIGDIKQIEQFVIPEFREIEDLLDPRYAKYYIYNTGAYESFKNTKG